MVFEGANQTLSCHKAEHGMKNSNSMINYTYCPGGSQPDSVKLIACLQGPMEPRFAAKQLPNKCFLEVNLKGLDKAMQSMKQGQAINNHQLIQRDKKKLEFDLRSVLEQLIQTTAYPKMIVSFNLNIVSSQPMSVAPELQAKKIWQGEFHLFSACMNACIALINRAGLN